MKNSSWRSLRTSTPGYDSSPTLLNVFKLKAEKKQWINKHFICAKHAIKYYQGPLEFASECKDDVNSEISIRESWSY